MPYLEERKLNISLFFFLVTGILPVVVNSTGCIMSSSLRASIRSLICSRVYSWKTGNATRDLEPSRSQYSLTARPSPPSNAL